MAAFLTRAVARKIHTVNEADPLGSLHDLELVPPPGAVFGDIDAPRTARPH
jgi:hypothetical protein